MSKGMGRLDELYPLVYGPRNGWLVVMVTAGNVVLTARRTAAAGVLLRGRTDSPSLPGEWSLHNQRGWF